uniref:hypothetical protein n=1 Tax=Acetatifactor sp. TaxID=1872090 RepID=UPI004056D3FC
MRNERNYYEEIQKGLQNVTANKEQVATVKTFCKVCQQYCWYYDIRHNMIDAEKVLQCHVPEDKQLTNKKTKSPKSKISLTEKLYLELLGEIHSEYYKDKMSYNTFIKSKNLTELIASCFNEKPKMLINKIIGIMEAIYDDIELIGYADIKKEYSKVHKVMPIVRNALQTPAPSIESSVERLIAKQQLETLISYLQNDNIAGALFTIAPITRAIFDGEYKSFIPKNDFKSVFFNLKSDYNLTRTKNYVEAIQELLEEYDESMEELNDYRSMSV